MSDDSQLIESSENDSGLDSNDGTEAKARFWYYYERYPYLLAKLACFGILAFGVVWMLQNVQAVLFPLFLSFLVAYLLDPFVDKFEARGISRTLAIIILLSSAVLASVLFIIVLYPAMTKQVAGLATKVPGFIDAIQWDFIPWLSEKTKVEIPTDFTDLVREYGTTIRSQIPGVVKNVSGWTTGLLGQTGTIIAAALNAVMIPVFSFYFLRDFDLMTASVATHIPPKKRDFILSRAAMMDQVVGAWFRGQVQVALILAVLYAVGLGIIFGIAGIGVIPGIAIGLLAGVLNIVPYFGFLIGIVLSTTMVLLNWSGVGPLIGLGAVFLVVQVLEGYVITPKIVGDKVGLSPVVVIIVLLLGGELFGLLGVLLAIPVAGIFRACIPDMIAYYRGTPFYSGHYQPPKRDSVGLVETLVSLDVMEDVVEELADTVEDVDQDENRVDDGLVASDASNESE